MISTEALAWRDWCWWVRCYLPGAPLRVEVLNGHEPQVVLVCGLHAELLAMLMPRPDTRIELWQHGGHAPVLVARRLQSQG